MRNGGGVGGVDSRAGAVVEKGGLGDGGDVG